MSCSFNNFRSSRKIIPAKYHTKYILTFKTWENIGLFASKRLSRGQNSTEHHAISYSRHVCYRAALCRWFGITATVSPSTSFLSRSWDHACWLRSKIWHEKHFLRLFLARSAELITSNAYRIWWNTVTKLGTYKSHFDNHSTSLIAQPSPNEWHA